MNGSIRILHVDDNPFDRELVRDALEGELDGFALISVASRAAFETALARNRFDLVLTDFNILGFDGLQVLEVIRAQDAQMPVVLVTGTGSEEIAVAALKRGAAEYVIKTPSHIQRLPQTIHAVLEKKRLQERHEQAEKQMRFQAALLNAVGQAVIATDAAGFVTYLNRAAEELYGWRAEEARGRSVLEVIVPQTSQVQAQEILTQLVRGESWSGEFLVQHRSGRIFPALVHDSPIFDERGQLVGIIGISTDISARLQTEEVLRKRLAELEALHTVSTTLRTAQAHGEALPIILDETLAALETDAGAVWLHDPATNRLRAAVKRGWFQQVSENPLRADEGITGFVFSTGQVYLSPDLGQDPIVRPQRRDQVPPGWGGACVPIRTGATIVGVLFVALPHPRQITAEQISLLESLAEMTGTTLHRMSLLQEAQEQAHTMQTILDTLPEGVLLLDEAGRVLLANPVAVHDLAVLADQKTDDALRPGSEQVITHLGDRPLAALLTPAPAPGEWHTVQAGTRTFEVIARPTSDTPGIHTWVLLLNDVTQVRVQQRYQQAQERLATVGQLAAGIAHDFNNIMGAITLYAGMLRSAPGLAEHQKRQVDTIHDQAQHAANLIRQILDFSRRSVLEKIALDLLPLVKELIKLLERTLPENIRLELRYDRSEYVIDGDPSRLQQALMNLALNARDAMPHGGRLRFTFTTLALAGGQPTPLPDMAAGAWLCLAVADTGAGIAAQHLPHIFDPFFTTKEPGKGTGLGLAQVYGIVKQHDGHIIVQSQVGQGAAFALYLPLLATVVVAAPMPQASPTQGEGETVLVVEDNEPMRMALVDTLELLNYRVLEAANGREALEVLAQRAGEIALVMSDLVMPEMGGQALLQAMRDRGLRLPLVVLSGHPLTHEMQALHVYGLAGWLLKPVDMEELAALLARALGKSASRSPIL